MATSRAHLTRAACVLSAALLSASPPASGAERPFVELFPGYGTPRTLRVSGRICEAPGGGAWGLGSFAAGVAKPFTALLGGSAGGETVTVRAGAVSAKAVTGPGGSFSVALPAAPGAPWAGQVRVTAVSGAGEEFEGAAYVPSPSSKIGLISSIDDTILMGSLGGAAGGDGAAAPPVPGMAELYARFAAGSGKRSRPVCYVAALPEAAGARAVGFLSVNRFPPGPVLLMKPERPGGAPAPAAARAMDHALASIQELLSAWPEKKFVLFGAAGQDDPDICRCIAARYRARIRGVYLRRNGPRDPARERAYPGFVFFDAAEEAAKDLARKGIIPE